MVQVVAQRRHQQRQHVLRLQHLGGGGAAGNLWGKGEGVGEAGVVKTKQKGNGKRAGVVRTE